MEKRNKICRHTKGVNESDSDFRAANFFLLKAKNGMTYGLFTWIQREKRKLNIFRAELMKWDFYFDILSSIFALV